MRRIDTFCLCPRRAKFGPNMQEGNESDQQGNVPLPPSS